MNKLFLIFSIVISSLFGCSKKEAPVELIKLECHGKTYRTSNSDKWRSKHVESYDVTKIYTLRNNGVENTWTLGEGDSLWYNKVENDPNQPGHPHWSWIISVRDDEIIFLRTGHQDFDKSKSLNDGMNQKNEYRDRLTINRITGEWIIDDNSKTTWGNSSWLTTNNLTKGTCKKAEKKF